MAHEEVKMPGPEYFISIKKDKINLDMELTKSAAKGKLSLNKAGKKKKYAGRNDDFILKTKQSCNLIILLVISFI